MEDQKLKISQKKISQKLQTGFIAQEVEQAAHDLGYKFSGVDMPVNKNDYYGIRYAQFVAPLIKAVQEQQKIIDLQEDKMLEMQNQINKLYKLLNENQ